MNDYNFKSLVEQIFPPMKNRGKKLTPLHLKESHSLEEAEENDKSVLKKELHFQMPNPVFYHNSIIKIPVYGAHGMKGYISFLLKGSGRAEPLSWWAKCELPFCIVGMACDFLPQTEGDMVCVIVYVIIL